jgi:biotin carboxylase
MTKNIILFVEDVPRNIFNDIRSFAKKNGVTDTYRIAVIRDEKVLLSKSTVDFFLKHNVIDIPCNLNDSESIQKALLLYHDELLVITCRGESHIPNFAKIVPNVPYLRTPTSESLLWSCDKIKMRKRFRAHNKSISPQFLIVKDDSPEMIQKIKDKVGFPLIIKPSNLAVSLLVSICFHEQELETAIKKIFKKIRKIGEENGREETPRVLVEQFMEGEMYSVDAYVNSKGGVYFCPFVHIKTGRAIGFDDFFGYQQITPTLLKKTSIEAAETVAREAIKALALRSSTAHIELMRTEEGWKVIEIGPRVGGFRRDLYKLSYDINHSMNDILIRIPKTPVVPKKVKGYSAAMKFFAKQEGILTSLTGIIKIQELASFEKITVNKKIGDKCLHAKNGGQSICNVILFNESRSELLADIRRLESTLEIKTEKAA